MQNEVVRQDMLGYCSNMTGVKWAVLNYTLGCSVVYENVLCTETDENME